MKSLIEDWRTHWNLGDIPFYYTQLFNIGALKPKSRDYYPSRWADIRDTQRRVLNMGIANIGMAVTIDTNEIPYHKDVSKRMHPQNKWPIGERLALLARKGHYGEQVIAESPLYKRSHAMESKMIVEFEHVGEGLSLSNSHLLKGFALAGEDRVFYTDVKAEIIGHNKVQIEHEAVRAPVSVRYAWARNPNGNLQNSAGLPASPFRSDSWPTKPRDGKY
jgi:sialate O-acetylesterase